MNGRNRIHIWIYDCGCVITRPREPSCNTYGTRWRVYMTKDSVKLKCRDCGRMHTFSLRVPEVQSIQYQLKEEMDR